MTLYMLFAGLAVLIYTGVAAARAPADTTITANASIISPNRSRAVLVADESARAQAAGMRLFQELGCSGCHRPDATGIGPVLTGLFGRPVPEQSCGAQIVDEEYMREAILNPSATVAPGFAPVMPTFAGRLTEEELQALIAYVRSLSVPVQARQAIDRR